MTDKKYNCLIVDDEPLALEAIEMHLSNFKEFHIVAKCRNAFEAIEILSNTEIDLVFLDINMPKISGLDFLKIVNKEFKVILTTAYREYALESYDFEVLDYLLKPIKFERFSKAIHKFIKSLTSENILTQETVLKKDYIFLRVDRKDVKVKLDDILFIEGMKDYVVFNLSDKKLITKKTFTNLISELPDDQFVRVHKSYIVSIKNIEAVSSDGIEIKNKIIPVTKNYKDKIDKIINPAR